MQEVSLLLTQDDIHLLTEQLSSIVQVYTNYTKTTEEEMDEVQAIKKIVEQLIPYCDRLWIDNSLRPLLKAVVLETELTMAAKDIIQNSINKHLDE